MKLKYNFITNKVGDKYVAVAVGDALEEFRKYIKMNETGKHIFDMLKNEVTKEEIIASIKENFEGATTEEITQTAEEFLEKLEGIGLIQ